MNRELRITSDDERAALLSRIPGALSLTDWTMLAYNVMSSHDHLVPLAGTAPPSRLMQSLNGSFAQWLNRRHQRLGPVFAERYASILFSEEDTARLIAYVHNNPVRAGVVRDPADSTWTSHRAFLGLVPPPPWLDVARGLSLCGFDSSPSGRLSFHDFVRARSGDPRDPLMSDDKLAEVRARIRELAGRAVEVSSPVVSPDPPGRAHQILGTAGATPTPRWAGDIRLVIEAVARFSDVEVGRIQSRERTQEVVDARRLALVVWSRCLGRDQVSMARALGISAQSASELLCRDPALAIRLTPDARTIAELCWALEGKFASGFGE